MGPDDATCMSAVAATLAPRVLRRPLSAGEVEQWAVLGREAAAALGDFDAGLHWLVVGLLQSPDFLYLAEVGQPHPTDPALRRLTAPELAARLSFFPAGTTPPEWLLAAAATGGLDTDAEVETAAQRLLSGPGADAAVARLWAEVLGADGLGAAAKDATAFPGLDPGLADSLAEELRLLVSDAARDPGRFEAHHGALRPWLLELVRSEAFRTGAVPEGARR